MPLSLEGANQLFDAILIDDDHLVHITWKSAAKTYSKKVKTFSHPDSFFAASCTFDKTSPVYVDAQLGQGIAGEEIARKIFELGFVQVYLATGYQPERFQKLDYLSGILGKEPPFI